MMQKKIVSIIVIIVIVAVVAVIAYSATRNADQSELRTEWITSGPFSVADYQHKLGENIFLAVSGIPSYEKGVIRVFTPKKVEYVSYPFDGSIKSDFNVYFKPATKVRENLCSPEDFIGIWTVEFDGVQYPPIQFEFIDEYIGGGEVIITNLCRDST